LGPPIDPYARPRDNHSHDGHGSDEGTQLLGAASQPGWATPHSRRFSRSSSVYSMGDSKYPASTGSDRHATFVPTMGASGFISSKTPYNPAELNHGRDPDDALHDPDPPGFKLPKGAASLRGCGNVLTLLLVMVMVVGLFLVYPVTDWILSGGLRALISNNQFVNATGQAAVLAGMPKLIDPDTPKDVYTRTGFDGQEYELVFSDEFNLEGRTFFPGGKRGGKQVTRRTAEQHFAFPATRSQTPVSTSCGSR